MLVTGTGLIPYPNSRILFGSLWMEMVKASFPCVLFSNKILFCHTPKKKKKKIAIFINQATEFMVSSDWHSLAPTHGITTILLIYTQYVFGDICCKACYRLNFSSFSLLRKETCTIPPLGNGVMWRQRMQWWDIKKKKKLQPIV